MSFLKRLFGQTEPDEPPAQPPSRPPDEPVDVEPVDPAPAATQPPEPVSDEPAPEMMTPPETTSEGASEDTAPEESAPTEVGPAATLGSIAETTEPSLVVPTEEPQGDPIPEAPKPPVDVPAAESVEQGEEPDELDAAWDAPPEFDEPEVATAQEEIDEFTAEAPDPFAEQLDEAAAEQTTPLVSSAAVETEIPIPVIPNTDVSDTDISDIDISDTEDSLGTEDYLGTEEIRRYEMQIGPIQMIVVGFDNTEHFEGGIQAALDSLRGRGLIKVLDLLFVMKNDYGEITTLSDSDLGDDDRVEYGAALRRMMGLEDAGFGTSSDGDGDVGAPADRNYGLSQYDISEVAGQLPTNTAAAILLIEHVWATEFRNAVGAAGGHMLVQGFVTPDALMMVGAELQAMADAQAAVEVADGLKGAAMLDALSTLEHMEQVQQANADQEVDVVASLKLLKTAVAADVLRKLVDADLLDQTVIAQMLDALREREVLSDEAVQEALENLPPGTLAALRQFQNTWSLGLKNAVRSAGGKLLDEGILTPESLMQVDAELGARVEADAAEGVANAIRNAALLDVLAEMDLVQLVKQLADAEAAQALTAAEYVRTNVAADVVRTLISADIVDETEVEDAIEILTAAALLNPDDVQQAAEAVAAADTPAVSEGAETSADESTEEMAPVGS